MPLDRSAAEQIREVLGTKNVRKFFPNPADPADEKGHPTKFDEFVNNALWWLGDATQVEVRDATTFVVDADGRIALDVGAGQRILKVVRVEQNDPSSGTPRFFQELRQDWGQGVPRFSGHWHVRNRTFFALGVSSTPLLLLGGFFSGSFAHFINGFDIRLSIQPGPITLTYFGIPTEVQLDGNDKFLRAIVDHGVYQAYTDMIGKILRPKDIKLEGVPDIQHNAADYRMEAQDRLKKAKESVGVAAALVR